MNEWGYVVAGWGITFAVLVAYATWIVVRGRALSKQVPPEDRRWM